jgi:hypothetical protein
MNTVRYESNSAWRRSGAAAVAFGVPAAALATAWMLSLASAPTAHADDFTTVLDGAQAIINLGDGALTTGASDLGSGDIGDGLSSLFAGLDDNLLGAPSYLLDGSFELATGASTVSNYGYYTFGIGDPGSIADANNVAEELIGIAESDFTSGLGDLSTGDYTDGLPLLFDGTGDLALVPQVELIGLTDTLLGSL